jgi:hypothetical protein
MYFYFHRVPPMLCSCVESMFCAVARAECGYYSYLAFPAGWITSTFCAQASSKMFSLPLWKGCVRDVLQTLDEDG